MVCTSALGASWLWITLEGRCGSHTITVVDRTRVPYQWGFRTHVSRKPRAPDFCAGRAMENGRSGSKWFSVWRQSGAGEGSSVAELWAVCPIT